MDDRDAVVRALVRINTGANNVDTVAYIAQAREALAKGAVGAGLTHPECFIRVLALADDELGKDPSSLVNGKLDPLKPDLLDQQRLLQLTTAVLNTMLAAEFMRSEAVLTHAREFFPDFTVKDPEPMSLPTDAGDSLVEYCCHLVLGVACADRSLGDAALAQAIVIARSWGHDKALSSLIEQELKRSRTDVATLVAQADSVLAAAKAAS